MSDDRHGVRRGDDRWPDSPLVCLPATVLLAVWLVGLGIGEEDATLKRGMWCINEEDIALMRTVWRISEDDV